jgi:uridylate kinase
VSPLNHELRVCSGTPSNQVEVLYTRRHCIRISRQNEVAQAGGSESSCISTDALSLTTTLATPIILWGDPNDNFTKEERGQI